MVRTINASGLGIIKQFESCQLTAYPDPGTGGAPWTIGWGHTGPEVHQGMSISLDDADRLLALDLVTFDNDVAHLAPVATDNQFSALVSFAYNEGVAKLRSSTLLRLHNAKNYVGAQDEFHKWIFADGRILRGLIMRRAAEAALYGTP